MSLQTATKMRKKERKRRWDICDRDRRTSNIGLLSGGCSNCIYIAVRHSNCFLSKWSHPLSAACGWCWWSNIYNFLLLACFIGLSISQSINRLVYRQTAWTEITSRLTKYAIVQLYPWSLLKPNTHRRRWRDSTRQLCRVGGVYWA